MASFRADDTAITTRKRLCWTTTTCTLPRMPNVEKHSPGSFCWFELGTGDQEAAKKFYRSLFSWDYSDFPMGPAESYTIFKVQGRDAAAAYNIKCDSIGRAISIGQKAASTRKAPTKAGSPCIPVNVRL